MKKTLYIILLYVAVALTAGCTHEKAGGSMNEKVHTALTCRNDALEYDMAVREWLKKKLFTPAAK